MEKQELGQWLEEKCQKEHLTLRQAATKTGLSHVTIAEIIKGSHPLPETIRKLAKGFGGDGTALEDYLLLLADYRTQRPGEPSEALAELVDKVRNFSEPELEMMGHFADFLIEIENKT